MTLRVTHVVRIGSCWLFLSYTLDRAPNQNQTVEAKGRYRVAEDFRGLMILVLNLIREASYQSNIVHPRVLVFGAGCTSDDRVPHVCGICLLESIIVFLDVLKSGFIARVSTVYF